MNMRNRKKRTHKLDSHMVSTDLPWLLVIVFIASMATDSLPEFDKKVVGASKPPVDITQLEVKLKSKEAGNYYIFKNGKLLSQGSFTRPQELAGRIGKVDKGYIDGNLELSLGDLERFKQKLNNPNIRVYHVR